MSWGAVGIADWVQGVAAGLAGAGGALAAATFVWTLMHNVVGYPEEAPLNRLIVAGAASFVTLGSVAAVSMLVHGSVAPGAWVIAGGAAIVGFAIAFLVTDRVLDAAMSR